MSQKPQEQEDNSEMAAYAQILQDLRENRNGNLEIGEMHKRIREKLDKAIKALESKQQGNSTPPKEEKV